MMGNNNLSALNTAKSITKRLVVNKQHLTDANERPKEVNLSKNKTNSESTSSDYGVTSHRQLSSAAFGSGYLKETSNGFSVVNVNSKHSSSSGHMIDHHSNKSPFVYYGQAPQENKQTRHKNQSIEAPREERIGSTVVNQSTNSVGSKKCPVLVDLTLDDSDDDDDGGGGSGSGGGGCDGVGAIVQQPTDTLPKILAAYSLNAKHSSCPATEICNLLSQKAKENLVQQNRIVINGSSANIATKGPNTGASRITKLPVKQGLVTQTKSTYINSSDETTATFRNYVMNDVTNLRNESLGTTKKPSQMVFANWSVKHDSYLDSSREQSAEAATMDTSDQVIITKVVTSTEKSMGHRHHPRKAPIEVRELFFDDKPKEKDATSAILEQDALNKNRKNSFDRNKYVEGSVECRLEETDSCNGNIHGTPWSFTMNADVSIENINNSYTDNKIRNLKDRIAKQQEAVEKLRTTVNVTQQSCKVNELDRVLVVQIPDLKEELGLQSEKKQSFRVINGRDSINTNKNKRKRKNIPRKVGREPQSQMKAASTESYLPSKRTRSRIEKEISKQRLPRRPRGRSSPVVTGKDNLIPVVTKDLWHREMEKAETDLALSNRPMDQTTFLLFLGLRKVQNS